MTAGHRPRATGHGPGIAIAIVVAVACSHAPPAKTIKVSDDRATQRIDKPIAVTELGDATFVFSAAQVTILRRGTILATAAAPDGNAWTGGATIAAPDGDGRWAVGVARDGTLWRVTLGGEIEPVSDRLGLGGKRVRALRATGTTLAAELDNNNVAISSDGVHVASARVDVDYYGFAVARDRLAFATASGAVQAWDLRRQSRVTYRLPCGCSVAFLDADTDHARLVVATPAAIYVEHDGALRPRAAPARVTALAAAGSRAWIATAAGLYILERDNLTHTDAPVVAGALYGSPTGGVWIAGDHLAHYQIDVAAEDVAWNDRVAPVFQRVCSHCHLPGGDAGIDLSTVAAWNAERAELVRRVVVTRTMPPAGTELGDAERASLASWLDGKTSR